MPGATPHFRIVQIEVPGRLDVTEGRWVLRGHANRAEAVVVVESVTRARLRFRRLRRRREADADRAVPVTRVSVIDADPVQDPDLERWLDGVDRERAVTQAVRVTRRLLHLRAVAASDPDPRPLRAEDLTRAEVGYGTGEEVAQGRWTAARRAPLAIDRAGGVRRSGRGTGPEERLAELLAGRDPVLAAETLTLRARLDLDEGHTREAALQLRIALEAAVVELEPWRAIPELDPVLDALREDRAAVAEAAAAALRGGLSDEQVRTVSAVIDRLGHGLRRRNAGRRVGERAAGVTPRRRS